MTSPIGVLETKSGLSNLDVTRARRRPRTGIAQPVVGVLMALVAIGTPVWLVLVTSVKTQGEAQSPDLSLPTIWQAGENYLASWTQGEIPQGFVNSLLVVVPSVVLVLILGSMASWVFARRAGRLVATWYALAISGLLVPPAVITLVRQLQYMGIDHSYVGMIAAYVAMRLSMAVFFMTGFIRAMPRDLEEAAQVDGAKAGRVFVSVVLPLLRPVIATAAIFVTLGTWSDVFYAFFILGSGDMATLPLNLLQVASAELYLRNWNLIFAYIVLMSIPMVTLFIIMQRRVISGITAGAIK